MNMNQVSSQCWQDAYNRGQGVIPLCITDPVYWWLYEDRCYMDCDPGYIPRLNTVTNVQECIFVCPYKWADAGVDQCDVTDSSYYRGGSYISGGNCASNNPETGFGCEKIALLYYPICALGFSSLVLLWCDVDSGCPGGHLWGGGKPCNKRIYDRPFIPALCRTGLVYGENDFLCYPPCLGGYDGNQICYQQQSVCPVTTPYLCNRVLCTYNAGSCGTTEITQTTSIVN